MDEKDMVLTWSRGDEACKRTVGLILVQGVVSVSRKERLSQHEKKLIRRVLVQFTTTN